MALLLCRLTFHYSARKKQINDISEKIDKRTPSYKRRIEALETAPSQIPDMVQCALSAGIEASYVLMDSWFTQQPLIHSLVEQGIDVIGMVKATNQRYLANEKRVDLKELYHLAEPTAGNKGIMRSI